MKIVLTGGGTGGHFYPLIAIAEELRIIAKEQKYLDLKIYYMAPHAYNAHLLFENNIIFVETPAGKNRKYFSLLNFLDYFKTGWGILIAIWNMYKVFPDVVFGKGGYVSYPPLFAARLLGIPVIIHESDSMPGRVNLWAGKFARRIALSYPDAAKYFPEGKSAVTGNPIREEITLLEHNIGHEFLGLEKNVPTILVVGGSLGSEILNDTLVSALPKLLEKYQIIHQTGKNNFSEVEKLTHTVLSESKYKARYKPFAYLNDATMRAAAGISELIVSRAGSMIFEIALWKIPSIIVPIASSNGDHQLQNAFAYARTGAAVVIEENNLNPNILVEEIERLMNNPTLREKMKKGAESFARKDAAELIANEIIALALPHER